SRIGRSNRVPAISGNRSHLLYLRSKLSYFRSSRVVYKSQRALREGVLSTSTSDSATKQNFVLRLSRKTISASSPTIRLSSNPLSTSNRECDTKRLEVKKGSFPAT